MKLTKKWFAVPINSGLMHALEHGRTRSYDFPYCVSLVLFVFSSVSHAFDPAHASFDFSDAVSGEKVM